MERKVRFVWWGVLVVLIVLAIWKLFLPHGSRAYIQKSDSGREIVVYVTGAVSKPGLEHLAIDARLDDALKAAQPVPEANLDVLNPAQKLTDGQKITIPFKNQQTAPENAQGTAGTVNPVSPDNSAGNTGNTGNTANTANTAKASSTASAAPSPGTSGNSGDMININTADAAELDKLPGVGPALAQRIIQYRTDHGLFANPEDLKNVSGIGDKTYEKMAAQVTTGP